MVRVGGATLSACRGETLSNLSSPDGMVSGLTTTGGYADPLPRVVIVSYIFSEIWACNLRTSRSLTVYLVSEQEAWLDHVEYTTPNHHARSSKDSCPVFEGARRVLLGKLQMFS